MACMYRHQDCIGSDCEGLDRLGCDFYKEEERDDLDWEDRDRLMNLTDQETGWDDMSDGAPFDPR